MIAKNKLLVPIVSAFMAISLMAGCSSNGGNSGNGETANGNNAEANNGNNPAAVFELGKEQLDFTLYGHYDWYTMPEWGGDITSTWIRDTKKVNVKPIHSGGAAPQKLNTMIATGDLPDAIWLERVDVEKLRNADMLVAFDDYIDKYPNLKKWLGEEGINMLRSEDGKLYQFPNWYTKQPNGNAGYVVNKKIYTELGSPKLETTDDLYNYLKLVKEKYPNVIPYEPHLAKDGQGLDVLYSAFKENDQKYPGMRAVPNGDKLTSIFLDPAFREAAQYQAKLFREKLITQDAMTQTMDQITEKVMTGRVAVFAAASPTEIAMQAHAELTKTDPEAGYFMIWPIHKEGIDKNKVFPGTYGMLGWNVTVITKSAKNPEAIFAFYDWLTGPEGQSALMWGPPGIYWDGVEADGETPVFTEKYTSEAGELAKLQAVTTNLNWVGNTVFVDQTKAKFEATLPVDQQNWATRYQREITWKTQSNATEFINIDPQPETEEGIIRQRIEDLYVEVKAKALFAKSDAEVLEILDQAEKDAQAAGYDKLLAFKTQKWQENLVKMKTE
ncbi:extracellular solute-binding protein [Paenibacillus alkaliterrae]|uniref:extracellular solute-binding protein n=1 Tax=Paenibacillus alkaliterrae TaxID=320909 RepID=UPI001F42332A|nr:extracellular solute-binding protein [Paenibacillus alkaliterrae]MCF2937823.1 extracellular solute-binding protein [Paenibacillus alkaliterrae]